MIALQCSYSISFFMRLVHFCMSLWASPSRQAVIRKSRTNERKNWEYQKSFTETGYSRKSIPKDASETYDFPGSSSRHSYRLGFEIAYSGLSKYNCMGGVTTIRVCSEVISNSLCQLPRAYALTSQVTYINESRSDAIIARDRLAPSDCGILGMAIHFFEKWRRRISCQIFQESSKQSPIYTVCIYIYI